MKIILSMILFLSIGNSFAQDKNISNVSKDKKEQHPCEKDQQSLACKDFLKKVEKDFPCATDLSKYCSPKDIASNGESKKANIEDINRCLEQNIFKLSPNCQKSLEVKLSLRNCMDAAMARCSGLKASKEIDCLAEEQPKAVDECQKRYAPKN